MKIIKTEYKKILQTNVDSGEPEEFVKITQTIEKVQVVRVADIEADIAKKQSVVDEMKALE